MAFESDASYVIYVATANSLAIERPLLSRFALFYVLEPNAAQALAIARSVARAVLKNLGLESFEPIARGKVLQELATYESARRMRDAIEAAAIRALKGGRRCVLIHDLRAEART